MFFFCCHTISYSQESTKQATSIDSLELQKTYIRSLVDQQKKQILKKSNAEGLSRELDISKLKDLDSIVAQNVKISETENTLLKEAAKDHLPKHSALRKTLIIGGLSVCAVTGAVIYFLTKDDSKNSTGADPDIVDKPPLHP